MKKFRLIKPDPTLQNNLMAFGYETDEGWWPLIDECVGLLEAEAKKSSFDCELTQVKEKFGILRIYLSSGTEAMYDIIDRYEILSSHICEICGRFEAVKTRVKHRWYKTTCDRCADLW